MKIGSSFTNKYVLQAVAVNHELKGFEDNKTPYMIFNNDMNTYNIVLEKEVNGDELFRSLSKFFAGQTKHNFDLDFDSFMKRVDPKETEKLVTVVINAMEYGSVVPWSLNKELTKNKPENVFVTADAKVAKLAEEKLVIAEDRTFVRRLQDMPSNLMVPGTFEKEIREFFHGLNVKITVLNKDELVKKGMNLLVGVGQGAQEDMDQPRLMVVEYLGNPDNKNELIGFIGKGVCFDSGGMNLKPGNHMRWMKYDMSGAAIVAGTVHALVANKVKTNAVAVMPLVLNLIDNKAQRPDDVLVSYNGMSVEIDNTDAEGRLILADAITYAVRDLKVTEIYDIATLTGAMIYALGDTYTGVWTSNDALWADVLTNADACGELVWRLPFHHDFKDLLKSKYADIANSVSDARGGSSRAAMFLKQFTEDLPYAHFDVAATADKGNTGTGIMLNTFYNVAKNKAHK